MEFDYEPTIEDEINSNEDLNSVEKKLLIQQANIEFYRAVLILVLCALLMGVLAVILKGWLLAVIDGAIFCGTGVTYTLLEDKRNHIALALAEESQKTQEIELENKKRKRRSLSQRSES